MNHCDLHKHNRKVGIRVGRVQKLWQRQSICINIRRIDTILDLLDLTLGKSGRCPKTFGSGCCSPVPFWPTTATSNGHSQIWNQISSLQIEKLMSAKKGDQVFDSLQNWFWQC